MAATVGIRALKQNASVVVARAAAGEVLTITDRGRPVAQLVPVPEGRVAALVASGQARPAKGALGALGPPPAPGAGEAALSEVVAAMRAEQCY